ncbi:MAG: hypothetical protein KC620_08130 [Myxococcales bacterium]|nr:hypothetical protein [Myxococcales bacterium]
MLHRFIAPLAILLCASAVWAQAGPDCDAPVEVDRFRELRQLTLDLYGRVPSQDELEALVDEPAITDEMVDALINAPEFDALIRRHHRDLLWPSTEALDILNAAFSLLLPAAFYEGGGDPQRLFLLFTGFYERGGLIPCRDEPAEWDADGELIFEPYGDGTQREGYVMVEPYWAPGTEVKVCALEARNNALSATGQPCTTPAGMASGTCGCGEHLERCADFTAVQAITASLQEQLLRMVEAPIHEGRPYTDMLLSRTELVNGPLVHYYRYLAPMGVDPIIQVPPVALAELPDMPFTDTSWHEVERSNALHSGILTSMSFLLRFQTSRARANRFHHAFLCDPFVAPEGSLPSPNDECSDEPNLRERCGCNYCHSRLEPASAWWGRFADAGTLYLDPAQFPTYLARCADCANEGRACDFICNRFYVSEIGHEKQVPYAGVLKAYEWRDEEEVRRVETGPRGFVEEAIHDGRLAQCAAEQLFTRLYKRPPTADERLDELPRFAQAFTDSGYDFKALVKALVTDPAYRRMVR